ncbi:MAG: DUF3429 domain-containing protein [Chromatocurvus sp.]
MNLPQRLTQSLGYAGLLPFLGFALGVWTLEGYVQALSMQGFLVYSLAILCFLAGSLWGSAPQYAESARVPRLLVSNGVVIFAVLGFLTAQPLIAALLLMLGHLAHLWYELNTLTRGGWYRTLRTRLTLIAVVSHVVYAAGLVQLNP